MIGRNSFAYRVAISIPRPRRVRIGQQSFSPPTLLSALARTTTLLTLSMVIVTFGVFMGAAFVYPDGYPDPLLAYQPLFNLLGQDTSSDRPFLCQFDYVSQPFNETSCYSKLDSDSFKSVRVVGQEGKITQVWLNAKSLNVVDVVRRWGPPGSVKQSGSHYLLRWESGMLVYAVGRHFHYQLPVTRIVFQLSDE